MWVVILANLGNTLTLELGVGNLLQYHVEFPGARLINRGYIWINGEL